MGNEPSSRIGDPDSARPIQFALQVGLAALWKSWGIVPDRVVGDGIGRVAAAFVAGTLSLEDAARIIAEPDRETAQLSPALSALANEEFDAVVEVGPHPVLASAIKECLRCLAGSPLILASLRRGCRRGNLAGSSAAHLYVSGFDLQWSMVSPSGRFVHLPSYPWQRERFWIDQGQEPAKTRGITDIISGDGASSLAPPNDANPRNLSDLTAAARHERLIEYFRDRVADVLGLAPEKIDPDRPLLSLGLDSLTAIDLKAEIEAGLSTELPLSMLLDDSGIRVLAEKMSAQLGGTAARSSETEMTPVSGESDRRLSHEQQLLWYADQFTPNRAAYHITGAATIRAELDIDAFRRAFRRVIAGQDALRTTFVVVDEKPMIEVLAASELELREDEWLPIENVAGCGDAEVKQKLTLLANRPFDLEQGPLFRLHLLSRSVSEHVVLLVVHHIIADFWSTAVLVDDLGKAYAAELAGRAVVLSPPRSRYADFTHWQHAMVAGEEGERHWAYWRQQLSGPLPVLDLPSDFARPSVRSFQGATKHVYLDPEITRGIVALGESLGISLYTTLLAAFQVFLGRMSGQDDVIVGSPVAGRTRLGFESLIGYFVNLVPMRSDLRGNPPFDEFVGRVRRTVAEGLEHQDFPFSLVASRLQGSPDPSRPPVFQVMFAHQKAQRLDDQGLAPFALGIPGARLSLHGLTAESIEFEKQTALFDLTMMTAREGDRLCVALEYSTDLFTEASIDRMAGYFLNLLEGIVANPGRRLADFPLLSQPERYELLGDWAEAPAVPHDDMAIHHRFERHVERSPDTVALVWGEDSFTYRELNRLANSLAHRLVGLGVKPETVVGLYLERWPSRLIGLLAILKAGGAYLPLDPDHPVERVATILEDSGATILLTEEHLRSTLPESPTVAIHVLDEAPGPDDPGNPSIRLAPDNLAYVVFTSGSTGRPKGVMVSHRSLLAVASAWELAYSLRCPPLRHLQAAGFSFDVFTGDWVRALSTGGTLVGCPRSVLLDPAALCDLIRRERIECLELVPALADLLATHIEQKREHLGGIRLLAVGSDTVRGRLYRRLRRLVGPGGQVVNSYGLTETTIDSTFFGAARDGFDGDGPVPIGRPLAGTWAYVLDPRCEPLPWGVVGELYIGGRGVARGYVADPAQTAERFVPDPNGGPGARMYATGDRARRREGGVLELLGRRDGQVKVRGFRVELGEVEAVLAQHEGVKEAAVVVLKDNLGESRLVAYLVPGSLLYPTTSDLRRWLKDRMPEPMIPSSFVFLEALPLSPNGKLDRSALRPPANDEIDASGSDYVPPRSTAEEILAGITADLVGRSRVGIHDNFFEIGVDSIIGVQIVSRARQAGLTLEPAHLFRHPTIAELAAAAESFSDNPEASETSTIAIAPFELAPEGVDLESVKKTFADYGGIEDLYPLTPVQEGMLFHTLADPDAGHYVEQFVCRLRGELDPVVLEESWHRLIARHPALRSSIHWTESDQRYQVVHRPAGYPVDCQDWRELTQPEQHEQFMAYLRSDRRRGFDPSRPPLSRLALLRLGEDLHQLVWSIHHVVIDGWCLSVLLHELLQIYEAVGQSREPALKPSRPYRDYVALLSRQADEPAQEYWTQVLRGVTSPTPLELSGPSSAQRGSTPEAIVELTTSLPLGVTAALDALGRSGRLTLSTLIQGAWALLLARYSGRSDVLFGVTVSGRPPELSGVESMVGMFINVLPLRVAVTEDSDLVTWLRALQATMVELRRYERMPLSQIQAWSELPSGMPLFESILVVQNLPFLASLQERANLLGIESARFIERTHYPLAVTVIPGRELEIKIGFDAHRFEPATIERALGHLRTVLEAMVADPERRLVDLPWMTDDEQSQLLGQLAYSEGESRLDNADLDQLSEEELDTLMGQLSAGMRE